MKFTPIDLTNWKRSDIFQHFIAQQTSFSMTKEIDTTQLYKYLKENNHSFYLGFIYLMTTIANQEINFRMSFNSKGQVGYWETLSPLYTIFDQKTQQFSALATDYSPIFTVFKTRYVSDLATFSNTGKLFPQPSLPENVLSLSMIPWTSFTGFNLNVTNGEPYLLPIVTGGKFIFRENKILLPVSIQVHHAVCDGFHVAKFFNTFEKMAADPQNYFE